MGAAGYVGRVGALAVAVGIGVAVSTGAGAASADVIPGADPSVTPSTSADARPGLLHGSLPGHIFRPQLPTSRSAVVSPTTDSEPTGIDLGRAVRRFVERGVTLNTRGAPRATTPEDAADEQSNPDATVVTRTSENPVSSKSSNRVDVSSQRPHGAVPVAAVHVVDAVAVHISAGREVAERAAGTVFPSPVAPVAVINDAVAVERVMAGPAVATALPVSAPGLVTTVLAAIGLGAVAPTSPLAPGGIASGLGAPCVGRPAGFREGGLGHRRGG